MPYDAEKFPPLLDDEQFGESASTREPSRRLTEEAVASAMEGIWPTPAPPIAWLANECRKAVHLASFHFEESEKVYPTTSHLKRELGLLAKQLETLHTKLKDDHKMVNWALHEFSFKSQPSKPNEWRYPPGPEYKRYVAAVKELEWMSDFAGRAQRFISENNISPRPREMRMEARTILASYLARVFSVAYGRAPSLSKSLHDKKGTFGPFADFYLALGGICYPDLDVNLQTILEAAIDAHLRWAEVAG